MTMRSALRLLPLMALGAVAAFLLAGPLLSLYKTHVVASRPQPTPTVDPHPSPTACPASLPTPTAPGTAAAATTPPLPFAVWVNDPLGVNLRAGASASSARLATLTQGTQATADGRAPDASGNLWYHVRLGSQAGWLRADFVSAVALHPASGPGWSLMLPQGLQASGSDPSLTTIARSGDAVPVLVLQTAPAGQTLTMQPPAAVRTDLTPITDHQSTIQVWNYTVTADVSRVALDTCKVTSAWARPDQGWPYLTSVFIHTSSRNYQFIFLSPDPTNATVRQILDSVALS
jgi:Bacterial SH3 domain